jgi:hypothetical protein
MMNLLDSFAARPPQPRRQCGEAAPCVRILRSASFVVVGNRYEHACDRCKVTFSVEDLARIASALVAAVALCCAAAFVVAHPPGSAIGAEDQNRWFGVALAVFGGIGWLRLGLLLWQRSVHRTM